MVDINTFLNEIDIVHNYYKKHLISRYNFEEKKARRFLEELKISYREDICQIVMSIFASIFIIHINSETIISDFVTELDKPLMKLKRIGLTSDI